jgi:ribonuclease BN (tRNA processing enzyme)
VKCAEACLLVDCPHPIRKILREAGRVDGKDLDVGCLTAVALTHLHADHSSGLEGLAYYSHFMLGRRIPLLAHPDVSARLWHGRLAVGMEVQMDEDTRKTRTHTMESYFDPVPITEGGDVQVGPFAVACRKTLHPIPTTALRIRAGGRVLGYSADTAFDHGLIDWLSDADLIIHETNAGIHTPYEKLAALPERLRARMRLIHYPDDFSPGKGDIPLLRQGERLVF